MGSLTYYYIPDLPDHMSPLHHCGSEMAVPKGAVIVAQNVPPDMRWTDAIKDERYKPTKDREFV